MKKRVQAQKATIGINLAMVAVMVTILEVFKPAIFIKDSKMINPMLSGMCQPSKAGKVMINILANPAAMAAQAKMVTVQPRKPTLKPIKSPKSSFGILEGPAVFPKITRDFCKTNCQHDGQNSCSKHNSDGCRAKALVNGPR